MLKVENVGKLFSLQYLYNMHKTLFFGGYLLCNIKDTIFVRCTIIADKKSVSQKI